MPETKFRFRKYSNLPRWDVNGCNLDSERFEDVYMAWLKAYVFNMSQWYMELKIVNTIGEHVKPWKLFQTHFLGGGNFIFHVGETPGLWPWRFGVQGETHLKGCLQVNQ